MLQGAARVITIVMAYYENPFMLERQLKEWSRYPEGTAKVIIVDDCSPHSPAEMVVRHHWLEGGRCYPSLYRVSKDRPWGQDAARNIGMHAAVTPWCLMTDMDHMLTERCVLAADEFVKSVAQRGTYYMPSRVRMDGSKYHPHPNSFLFNRIDFWDMGGYDEDFVGYYGSDGNFRKCAKGNGLREVLIDEFALVMYGANDIADARTTAFTRKEGELWAAKHPVLNAKRMGPPYRAVNPFRVGYTRVL